MGPATTRCQILAFGPLDRSFALEVLTGHGSVIRVIRVVIVIALVVSRVPALSDGAGIPIDDRFRAKRGLAS